MHSHHKFISAISPAFTVIKRITKKNSLFSNSSLRVLAYHDIPENQKSYLSFQLSWIKKHWNIIPPSEFELMITGEKPIIGDNVLITFDDGFLSNRVIAEEILKPLSIEAIFFVVSDFVSINDIRKAHHFVSKNIIPGSKFENIPDNFVNMRWNDLEELLDYGHTIGSHTKSHLRLDSSVLENDLNEQLIISADTISERLGINIDHFAYTFGDINSFTETALKFAKKRYKFIYSGIRGDNIKNMSPYSIKRDAAAYQLSDNQYKLFSNKLLGSFLDGFVDFRYRKQRLKLDSWAR
mgnify:CR=1 FL=1